MTWESIWLYIENNIFAVALVCVVAIYFLYKKGMERKEKKEKERLAPPPPPPRQETVLKQSNPFGHEAKEDPEFLQETLDRLNSEISSAEDRYKETKQKYLEIIKLGESLKVKIPALKKLRESVQEQIKMNEMQAGGQN